MRTPHRQFGSQLTRILALSFPLALFQTIVGRAQSGSLDSSFKPQTIPYSSTLGVGLQADGKILYLSSFPGYIAPSGAIGRVDTNGTADPGFPTVFLTNGLAYALALDGNNRIILGGSFVAILGQTRPRIARLNADGTLDPSFDPGACADGDVLAVAIQSDGRILIGGRFNSVNGTKRNGIARLLSNGSLDPVFDPGDGVGNAASSEVRSIAVLAGGKVLLGGAFTNFNGAPRSRVAQLNADGSLDGGFDPGSGPDRVVKVISAQPDGGIVVGGEFIMVNGSSRRRIARLKADGSLDPGFTPVPGISSGLIAPAVLSVETLALLPDGRILVGGSFGFVNGVQRPGLARLQTDGSLDYDFEVDGAGLYGAFNVYALAVQNDGKVVAGGGFSSINNTPYYGLARFNGGGTNSSGRFEFNSAQYRVDEGAGSVVVTVKRAGGSLGAATIFYSTADGTANAPADYSPRSGTLSFAAGETQKNFSVPIVDDNVAEGPGCCVSYVDVIADDFIRDEVFVVSLQNPSGSAVLGGQSYALVVIQDNDTSLSFSSPTLTVAELDGLAILHVNRTGKTDATNAVICSTGGGTATAGLDYVATSSTLVFAPGETTKDFRFVILEDELTEGDETVQVSLSAPTGGATLANPSVALVTIQDVPGTTVSTLPGSVDTTFLPGTGFDGPIYAIAQQSDGRLVVGGAFSRVDGVPRFNLARLSSDGSVDLDFAPSVGTNFFEILVLAIQSDGRILASGRPRPIVGTPHDRLVRLNADGGRDSSFDSGAGPEGGFIVPSVNALAVQPDGKIIVAGDFATMNGVPRRSIARLHSNGSLDNTFDPGSGPNSWLLVVALQNDGKTLIGGDFSSVGGTPRNGIARLNSDGSLDTTFNPTSASGPFNAIEIQGDGKIVVSGYLFTVNGSAANITRLNFDGSTDTIFQPGAGTGGDAIDTIALQRDGKLVIGGTFTTFSGTPRNRIARLNPDGRLDVTFDPGTGANDTVRVVALQSDGQVVIGGDFTRVNGRLRNRIARLTGGAPPRTAPVITRQPASQTVIEGTDVSFSVVASGFPLPAFQWTFNAQPIAEATTSALSLPNVGLNKTGNYAVVVTNDLGSVTSSNAALVVALAPSQPGALDLAFYPGSGVGGAVGGYSWSVNSIAVQGDGKLLIGGGFSSVNGLPRGSIARLNADGAVDASFDPGTGVEGGGVQSVAAQPDRKVLIAGWFFEINGIRRATIARLNSDGSVDDSFDPQNGASYTINDLGIQSDGKIVIGGEFVSFNGVARQGVVRLNQDGSLDPSFDPGTGLPAGFSGGVRSVALQSDGKVLIAGSFDYVAGQPRARIARLNTDGSLDPSFNPAAAVAGTVQRVALQTDGKILLAGYFTQVNGVARNGIARLNPDGSMDSSFHPGTGADGYVWALLVQNYGRVLIAGDFTSYNGVARHGVARLSSNGSLDLSFDPGAGANATVYAMALQGDGRVILGGVFTNLDARPRSGIARLMNDFQSAAGHLEFSLASQTIPENTPTNLVVKVRRIGGTNGLVQVNYAVSGGSATPGADFLPASGTLVFEDGDADEKAIALTVLDDQQAEGNETIDLWLGTPIGGAAWGPQAADRVTIVDDDIAVQFVANQFHIREGQGAQTVEVQRLGNTAGVVTVDYATSDGTAQAGLDYIAQSGTLSFGAGETNKAFFIPIIDDALPEEDETVFVTLSHPTGGARLGTNASAVLTIIDNDRPGTLDDSFDSGTLFCQSFNGFAIISAVVSSVAVQADGRVLVGGEFSLSADVDRIGLVRLLPDGKLDPSFVSPSSEDSPWSGERIALQPDGKALVVLGYASPLGPNLLVRLDTNGLVDPSFAPTDVSDGFITALLLQADGKILIGGHFETIQGTPRQNLARLNADGLLDTSPVPAAFGSECGDTAVTCLAIDADSKILLGGVFGTVDGASRHGLARLNSNGSLDATFDPGQGLANEFGEDIGAYPNAIVVQPDRKLVVGGAFPQVNGVDRMNLARLNPDGTLDTAFNTSVTQEPFFYPPPVSSLALQGNRQVVLAGTFTAVNGVFRNGIARLNSDGSLDLQFHSSETQLRFDTPDALVRVNALALQPDGQIVIGGNFTQVDGQPRCGVARLNGSRSPRQAIQRIISVVSNSALAVTNKQPLLTTLQAALSSLDRGNTLSAINQLRAFQNKVLAQVAPVAPGLAQELWQSAETIIDALPRVPHMPYFTMVTKQPGGRLKARFAGSPGQTYQIQATTNLVDWVTLGGATALGNGTFEFEDAEPDKLPARFYRVLSRQLTPTHETGTGAN